jgi:hypothetical protein
MFRVSGLEFRVVTGLSRSFDYQKLETENRKHLHVEFYLNNSSSIDVGFDFKCSINC